MPGHIPETKSDTPRELTMALVLLLLGLLSYFSGIRSQPTLTQPASTFVSLGETVKFSCMKSSGGSWDSFSWYQQRPGQAPHFVFYGSNTRGEGIPDRFTGSPSGNTGYLTITNVQPDDEGDYYCAAWEGSSSMYVFGGGTYLNVLGQSPVPPKVHLFPPSQQEIESKNKATLACLVDEFYPKTIEVNWQADGKAISSGVQTSPSTKQGEKYMATSYLILSKSEWDSHEMYACRVTHDGKTFEQVVKKSDCP